MPSGRPTGSLSLGVLVEPCIAPVLKRQGFVSGDVLLHWPEIAGERLAACSRPIELKWPRQPRQAENAAAPQAATLVVRVEGAMALEFDYARALLIERINARFGWRCVGKLQIRQGPVPPPEPPRRPPPPLPEAERQRIAGMTAGTEPALGAALRRLGEAIHGEAASRGSRPIRKA